jgi:DnaJ-class molecular chaperone
MLNKDNPYYILGVHIDATAEQIKAAYRKLSSLHHPDRNPDEQSTAKFQRLQDAYADLSDPESRKQIDARLNHVFVSNPEEVMDLLVTRFFNEAIEQ